ncbi:hypothetical protein GCM10011390_34450 [Aureimonas endophytica]|uniref:Uncharacterized protein n=1 Tax=Aureimonas endophytica TaxID=2027858 RepID=A0A916ZSP4_9HYPH|nr:hypothetical protein GCM10011390_34450 [Aureimonas endophytica]
MSLRDNLACYATELQRRPGGTMRDLISKLAIFAIGVAFCLGWLGAEEASQMQRSGSALL